MADTDTLDDKLNTITLRVNRFTDRATEWMLTTEGGRFAFSVMGNLSAYALLEYSNLPGPWDLLKWAPIGSIIARPILELADQDRIADYLDIGTAVGALSLSVYWGREFTNLGNIIMQFFDKGWEDPGVSAAPFLTYAFTSYVRAFPEKAKNFLGRISDTARKNYDLAIDLAGSVAVSAATYLYTGWQNLWFGAAVGLGLTEVFADRYGKDQSWNKRYNDLQALTGMGLLTYGIGKTLLYATLSIGSAITGAQAVPFDISDAPLAVGFGVHLLALSDPYTGGAAQRRATGTGGSTHGGSRPRDASRGPRHTLFSDLGDRITGAGHAVGGIFDGLKEKLHRKQPAGGLQYEEVGIEEGQTFMEGDDGAALNTLPYAQGRDSRGPFAGSQPAQSIPIHQKGGPFYLVYMMVAGEIDRYLEAPPEGIALDILYVAHLDPGRWDGLAQAVMTQDLRGLPDEVRSVYDVLRPVFDNPLDFYLNDSQ